MSEKILAKLKKMLQQEEGERKAGNLKTAENIAATIKEWLDRHKLELSDVEQKEEENKNPFLIEVIQPDFWGQDLRPSPVLYVVDVCTVIARAYYCRTVYYDNDNTIGIVGRKSDIEITKYIFLQVMRSGLAQCEGEIAESLITPPETYERGSIMEFLSRGLKTPARGDDYRKSFFYGFMNVIDRRLTAIRRKSDLSGSTALVLAEKAVDNYLKSMDNIKEEDAARRLPITLDEIATHRGAKAGENVTLSPYGLNNEFIRELGE